MKKLIEKIKDKLISILITALCAGFIALCSFGYQVYQTVQDTVPKLKDKVDSLDNAPLIIQQKIEKINNEVGDVKDEQEYIKDDIKEIKDMQTEQRQNNQRMLELLIQIRDND